MLIITRHDEETEISCGDYLESESSVGATVRVPLA